MSEQGIDPAWVEVLEQAMEASALPGDLDGYGLEDLEDAARFVAETAQQRKPGRLNLELESSGGEAGQRRMRLALVNDDMPFLVDSVAGAIAARGLSVYRLLHPIIRVRRDAEGRIIGWGGEEGTPESLIFIELDRADARGRHDLSVILRDVLEHVRAAVRDWKAMLAEMASDAERLREQRPEAANFLDWLGDNNFTLLGHLLIGEDGKPGAGLGILRDGIELWDESVVRAAIEALTSGGRSYLILKADQVSPVHRRVPLDVIMVRREQGISVHCGLWTSEALRAPAAEVPILRQRLAALDKELGFSPASHGGKALTHAISTLPHDLVISFEEEEVRLAALTAMSLADRPRPTLLVLQGTLQRHLYAFVWLPRDELSTSRRLAIAMMLEDEVGSPISSWSVELGDGELALLRYTMATDPSMPLPDVEALDRALVEMVRGWAPAVEAELIDEVGAGRATRLALSFLPGMPESYRARTTPREGALDITRMSALDPDLDERSVRLVRAEHEAPNRLRLKTYRANGIIPLSEAVPVLEYFGFEVLEEIPTALADGALGYIHDFHLELPEGTDVAAIMERAEVVEAAIAEVMQGEAENDGFNSLVLFAGLEPRSVVWLRAWFRYMRQIGVAFGLATVVETLQDAPTATAALIDAFIAAHDPQAADDRAANVERALRNFDDALSMVQSIDDDRILRLFRAIVKATLRTNAFAVKDGECLAFKFDSAKIPGLPAPVPYREIWVYGPRVEGIHLRGGPVARGGLRWSDRRDDFRTEVLGLVKAQLVKNAVIVPTGAKGGFYAKQLPNPNDREAWFAEGTEAYRTFIRSLLSVTDNIVDDKVVHPDNVVVHDGDDPYFVVAADKGTATFSDIANAIALERGFWLGDAFASGGSNGYDHKAMGITAKGAWVSVQRHFLEMGIDVQTDPIDVVGVGDMSGDVFGNGMMLSKALRLVAAFDHRHIFIDPDPDPATSWEERKRLFEMGRSSWDDYDRDKLSPGAMIVRRDQKSIRLTAQARAALGLGEEVEEELAPQAILSAILKAPADLLWFGGIGTYVKAARQSNAEVGDPTNDAIRVNAEELRVKAIGEGANLGITQEARIEFALGGGRINTDFIDNSAGVDCSDNEVNIKIPLNREMREGRLDFDARNRLLEAMTDEVAALVLEDNRLQALALSVAEARGAVGLPGFVRTIEILEASGRLDRRVEGLASSEALMRRGLDNVGMTRPELAVVLSMSKMALQDAAEQLDLAADPALEEELYAAFPRPMIEQHRDAVAAHRLENEIIATKVANRLVNRLGPSIALDMTEEEGVALGQVAVAFIVAERILGLPALWARIEAAEVDEKTRIELFSVAARSVRSHLSDILRSAGAETRVSALLDLFAPGYNEVESATQRLIRAEVRNEAQARRERLTEMGADPELVDALIHLYEMDGVFGLAALGHRKGSNILPLTAAYTRLGEALGLDWAQQQLIRYVPADNWERLLVAGLARDFEQLRIDFLAKVLRGDRELEGAIEAWIERNQPRIEQFRRLIERAQKAGGATTPMLAQIANQARILLAR
ncbi:NAD-glutamate dehydrogenase [Sphingomicrobium astaxanthinifaciens]|uniref:NAD-glutamate dehydrogenase n=1 Tax=Sphingomicrobium astaxanthinifaciens TaxID=1227949 RepID=UPI001FCC3294|nr:NAD-glutamate dehydrogenase domain-containing protein [Sphingomicrobium astaxanthinifaciens]MCJ7421442.1 NAD-glutamate dehydrogenase [Sphingomicrobium astaxanthinifaciens]